MEGLRLPGEAVCIHICVDFIQEQKLRKGGLSSEP